MNADDEFELKAGASSVSISAKGSAASRLGHATADLLSPFSHGMGLAGDYIRQFRIHREEAARTALARAQEIRVGTVREDQPVSPKLLAPWIEGASTEDLEGENIIELWAQVLAKAPTNFDSRVAAFIDVCSRIGALEANFFEKTADDIFPALQIGAYAEIEWIKDNFGNMVFNKIHHEISSRSFDEEEFRNFFIETMNNTEGRELIRPLSVSARGKNFNFSRHWAYRAGENNHALLILRREGIFDVVSMERGPQGAHDVTLSLEYLTLGEFGFEFARYLRAERDG